MASLKHAAAWGLVRSGLLSLHRAGFQRSTAVVLLYHRVNDERDPFFPSLPVRHFVGQLQFLARHYAIEPLEATLDWLAAGAPGRARAVVTIDDGYPDTREIVFPQLQRLGLPATLFLCTGPPETRRPVWSDRARAALKHARTTTLRLPALGLPELRLDSLAARLAATERLLGRMKQSAPDAIARVLAELERQLEPGASAPRLLSWDDVRHMAKGPLALGAHTHNHYELSRLDDEQIRSEISTSIELIERRVAIRVSAFAYPNGQPEDYDDRSLRILPELGLRCALTSRHGFARAGQDLYQIGRVYTSEPSLPLFATRVGGLSLEALQEAPATRGGMVLAE
jgi:peptidoglycan/xylan/chitin deacetylase (PgdA/CDA1 family)